MNWFWSAPASARRALLGAWLGWLLDAFDVMLYALLLGTLISEFSLSKPMAGLLGSVTLAASGIGGVAFGLLADRYGRRPALIGSLLVYSCFTFACGLATSVGQLAVFRFLLGLGMGGEWTSGAALVSETWPDAHRGKALGLMQSAWSIGYALAAVAVALILPRFGWRAVFFLGIVPAFVGIWVQRRVDESPVWLASRDKRATVSPLRAIFGPRFVRYTLLLTMLLILQVATVLDYVSVGFVADAIGRRRSVVPFILLAAITTVAFGSVRHPIALAVLGPITSFFGSGLFSGFGAVAAERYPTA